ncbi:MAG: hypothetical protein DMF53_04915 [Acidobacteria bacterium]|nr:MAG: hypothetical protein DMF53_04915 [Acidobacteriota bacterium]
MTINSFIGTWYIQYKSGAPNTPLQNGWVLKIGTGENGADAPFLSAEGAVCVGFALIDPQASSQPVVMSTEDHDGHQVAVLRLTGEQLRWTGYYNQQPAYIYISAAETLTPNGPYINLFGATTYGDPEQVAVWGGSATPPPPPQPKKDGDEG